METIKDKEKMVNILILGETGVGKSTFINAFMNYMMYNSLEEAEVAKEFAYSVSTKFTITNDDFEECTVSVGDDDNECNMAGASATQYTRSYVFPIGNGNNKVCLIDTPGIGDTRGLDQDNINLENILDYINNFEELHGICILLKPNNARLTALFETCIKQLLSRLEKSASRNIIFIFTNSRCTFYRPGDTMPALRNILDEIKKNPPYVEIPLNKNNVFCLDNEAFRFLVCIKNAITFTDEEREEFAASWQNSSKVCWDLIRYVRGDINSSPLEAHKIKNTISVSRARNVILELTQPIGEIIQIIIDNLSTLRRHKNDLCQGKKNLNAIKEKLRVPVPNLEVFELKNPRTVCTAITCCEIYDINGKKKLNYTTICHDPCYLKNTPKDVIGSKELIDCYAFDSSTQKCKNCGCSYLKHMHIYYGTRVVLGEMIDENTLSRITNKESALKELAEFTKKLDQETRQWSDEKDKIIKICASFAYFLQNNSITPYSDVFEAYIEHLMNREHSLGQYGDKDMTHHLQASLRQYDEEKRRLQKNGVEITAEDIFGKIAVLYSLFHTGEKILELMNKRSKTHSSESNQNAIIINPKGIQLLEKNNEKMLTEEITVDSRQEIEKMLVDEEVEDQESMEVCDGIEIGDPLRYRANQNKSVDEIKFLSQKTTGVNTKSNEIQKFDKQDNKNKEGQKQTECYTNKNGNMTRISIDYSKESMEVCDSIEIGDPLRYQARQNKNVDEMKFLSQKTTVVQTKSNEVQKSDKQDNKNKEGQQTECYTNKNGNRTKSSIDYSKVKAKVDHGQNRYEKGVNDTKKWNPKKNAQNSGCSSSLERNVRKNEKVKNEQQNKPVVSSNTSTNDFSPVEHNSDEAKKPGLLRKLLSPIWK